MIYKGGTNQNLTGCCRRKVQSDSNNPSCRCCNYGIQVCRSWNHPEDNSRWKEINKRSNHSLNKSPFKNLLKNQSQRNSDNNERKNIKKDLSGASWSSELDNDIVNDVLSGNEDKGELSLEFYTEEYKNILPTDNINNKCLNKINNININKKRTNSEDIYKSNNFFYNNKIYNNYWSLYSNKNEKNLIEIFTSSFCNNIIDYVNFFVEKLKLLNVNSPDEKVIDFFNLANKYH